MFCVTARNMCDNTDPDADVQLLYVSIYDNADPDATVDKCSVEPTLTFTSCWQATLCLCIELHGDPTLTNIIATQ